MPQSSKLTLRVRDTDGSTAQFSFYGASAADYAGYEAIATAGQALTTAIDAITNGVMAESLIGTSDRSSARPSDKTSRTRNQWLVRYRIATHTNPDMIGSIRTVRIATADQTQTKANSNVLDITAGAGLAFKNAFQAYVKPDDDPTGTVEVDSVELID